MPFDPLVVWVSPDEGGEAKGIPPKMVTEKYEDEYGVQSTRTVLKEAPEHYYSKKSVEVPGVLAKWLRPHQREGVSFMYECVMSLRGFNGAGCILADDMGLGKTLQSVCLIYTLLKTGVTADGKPTAKRIIVTCPCSLVKNWDNEFVKWLGPGGVKTLAIAEQDRKTVEKNIDCFVKTSLFNVLILSYECLRTHVGRLNKTEESCDLLVCDEAHRLKNRENQTSTALNSLKVRRRVLLTGTPMQNDLEEFYAMVDFTNRDILGSPEEFRRKIRAPILKGREPDATKKQRDKMLQKQNEMSSIVNEFILRRVNTVNAQHLPPKLVQVVCCKLTDMQQNIYNHLIGSKAIQQITDGKQVNCLSSIQMLMKLCNHPRLVANEDVGATVRSGRNAGKARRSYAEDTKSSAAPGAEGVDQFLPYVPGRKGQQPVCPEWSGKMFTLFRLMREMRKPGNGNDKIVIVSNYTQTLDLIGQMCNENNWGFCRLDGSIGMKKRQKMVDEFNNPSSNLVAFLLSSKAGGCGLNLIGGNRLVLFDPDWNPAVDKQAAARCWRDGQKKRCFTYRFLTSGSVEEKIYQRQLSKEGLQSVVDDKEQVNTLSTKDLRNLFKLRPDTPSDTHDKLLCQRCKIIADDADEKERRVLPFKLAKCAELLETIMEEETAEKFLTPLIPTNEGVSETEYDSLVKQPMDFSRIKAQLEKVDEKTGQPYYKAAGEFSKDVNRIFGNVAKVWNVDTEIGLAAAKLQSIWVQKWTQTVPILMSMQPPPEGACVGSPLPAAALCNECPPNSASPAKNDDEPVEVERSENFQEQLGMPEEEDMRNWSHHFKTDTCDDPIFRAAMQGYDTVSFVFGLEVTWDLITARKQEEEEQRALEELAKLEEAMKLEKGSDGDSSDDDEDSVIVDDGIEKPFIACDAKGKKKKKKKSEEEGGKKMGANKGDKKAKKKSPAADYEDSDDEGDDGPNDMGDFLVGDDEEEEGDFEEGEDDDEEEEEEVIEGEEEEEVVVEEEEEEEVVDMIGDCDEEEQNEMDVEEGDFETKRETKKEKKKRKKKDKEEKREKKRKKKEEERAKKKSKAKKKKFIDDGEEEEDDDLMFEETEKIVVTKDEGKGGKKSFFEEDEEDQKQEEEQEKETEVVILEDEDEEEEEDVVMREDEDVAMQEDEVVPPDDTAEENNPPDSVSKPHLPPKKSRKLQVKLRPPNEANLVESPVPSRKAVNEKAKIDDGESTSQEEVEKAAPEPPEPQAPPSPKAAPPRLSLGSSSASISTSAGFDIIFGETKVINKFPGYGEYEGIVTGHGDKEGSFVCHFEDHEKTTVTEKQLNAAIKKYNKKHTVKEAPSDGWACGLCTYMNKKGRKKCELCQTTKPSKLKKSGRAEKENTFSAN